MASERIKAERRAQAVQRLQDAKSGIAERLGIESKAPTLTNRDPELSQIQQTEDVADFLERVIEKMPDPEMAEAGRSALAALETERKQGEATDDIIDETAAVAIERIIQERDAALTELSRTELSRTREKKTK